MKKGNYLRHIFIGSRDFVRTPHLEGLGLELVSCDADPSIEGTALGEYEGLTSLFVTSDEKWSSVYKPNPDFFDQTLGFSSTGGQKVIREVGVYTHRIDTVFSEYVQTPYILSINAQGSSYAILKGAGDLINNCIFAQAEIEFQEQYKDAPLFDAVFTLMSTRNFRLIDLNLIRTYKKSSLFDSFYRKTSPGHGTLSWGDALFLNESLLLKLEESQFVVMMRILIKRGLISDALFYAEKRKLKPCFIARLISEEKGSKIDWVLRVMPRWLRRRLYSFAMTRIQSDWLRIYKDFSHYKEPNRFDRKVLY